MHSDTCTSLVSLVQCLLHFDSGTGIPATLWVCITLSYIVTSFATCDLFHWSSDIFFPKLNMVDLKKIIKITRSETHQIPAGFFTHLKVFRVRKNHRIFGPRIFSPCQTCRAKGLLDVFIFPIGNTFTNQIQGRASLDAEFHLSAPIRRESFKPMAVQKKHSKTWSKMATKSIPNQYQIYSF